MKKIDIFDPAMCCSTGVCGPSVDRDLMRIAIVVDWLKSQDVVVARHGLSSEPQDFIDNKVVSQALRDHGADALPLTLVDGDIAKSGDYPTNEELSDWLGVPVMPATTANPQACCGGDDTVGG